MKKYIFNRILRSLVSIFLVTTLTYAIVFTLVPRKLIFKQDPNYTKIAVTPDKKADYENTIYERMGYIDYLSTKELVAATKKLIQKLPMKEVHLIKRLIKLTSNRQVAIGNFKSLNLVNITQRVKFLFMNVFGVFTLI